MMKKLRSMWLAVALLTVLLSGCATAKLSSEDIEVMTRFSREIAVLHDPSLPPNSREKYEAAKTLVDYVDFSFTTDVSVLDQIFSSVDARVDQRNTSNQVLMFYYQYQDRSIRFLFYRFKNTIVRVEVIER